jgi:hypothetical protein
MSNGDTIVGLFNREITPKTRSVSFNDIGVSGNVSVRDLWQHNELGSMNSVSVQLPPHGSMVLKLKQGSSTCRPQSVTFNPIADWTFKNPPPTVSASASSGLPVMFEVALGPATVQNNQVHPTGQPGTVHVVASQPGNAAVCAAIPQVQSFKATGPHQNDMFLLGTFTSWTPIRMKLVGDTWVADKVALPAGTSEFKLANTANFSGTDWGNGMGLTATAMDTTGGKPNSQVTVAEAGFYRLTFNDVTLQYVWDLDPGPSASQK